MDEEARVVGEPGMEREREQALLPARRHLVPDVEERLRVDLRSLQDEDRPLLLDDVERPGIRAGDDLHRRGESGPDPDELQRHL